MDQVVHKALDKHHEQSPFKSAAEIDDAIADGYHPVASSLAGILGEDDTEWDNAAGYAEDWSIKKGFGRLASRKEGRANAVPFGSLKSEAKD